MNNGIVIGKPISIEFECFAVVQLEVRSWGGGGGRGIKYFETHNSRTRAGNS